MHPSRRSFIGGVAAATLASHLPAAAAEPAIPSRSGLPWPSGVRDEKPDTFVAYRGRPLDVLMTFPKRNTWAEIRDMGTYYGKLLNPGPYARPEALIISYPLFPPNESPKSGGAGVWQRAAAGAFDAHHDTAAAGLARFSRTLIFRIGWEWPSLSFPWGVTDPALAPQYRAYFKRVVQCIRRHRPGAPIDWCTLKKGHPQLELFYPGDDVVDTIGIDKYDWYPAATTQAIWDQDYMVTNKGRPKGLGTWLAFAKSHGKKLSLPEWGLGTGVSYGGGDNAVFVSNMMSFFRANAAHIGFESYFNSNHSPWIHRLQDNPKAGAAYRAAMNGSA